MFSIGTNSVCNSSKLSLGDPTIFRKADFNIAISLSWKPYPPWYFCNIGFHVTLISLK